jgi:regulator of ribosome biosynthesis
MGDTTMTDASATVAINGDSKSERLPVTVDKPSPYTYSLSYLTATDPNPLPTTSSLLSQSSQSRNSTLQSIARDGAQSLLTTLLTTTTILSTPDGLLMTLPPAPQPLLPRWKPLPKPKAPTKWETFARKKGIGKFGSSLSGGAKQEDRKKNLVYDDEKGEWVKKWGYQGKKMREEGQWLVEVDDKAKKGQEEKQGENVRMAGRKERKERMKRMERRQRGNKRRVRKNGG